MSALCTFTPELSHAVFDAVFVPFAMTSLGCLTSVQHDQCATSFARFPSEHVLLLSYLNSFVLLCAHVVLL